MYPFENKEKKNLKHLETLILGFLSFDLMKQNVGS